jgi:serine phosphatase RsbU (regulator of sigma subunit)
LIDNVSKDGQKDGFDGILICIESDKKTVTYAAANNKPIQIRKNEFIDLGCDRMPVGIGEKSDLFSHFTINYEPGDLLYLYTDGYADQFGGPKGKKFKYKTLNDLLLSVCTDSMQNQYSTIKHSFETWKGELEQVDDICLIGIVL